MTVIRTVDIETTGFVPPQAEVIELGAMDVVCQPDGSEARVRGEGYRSWLYQPERPCPPEVMAVHHILPEQTMNCEPFSPVQAEHNMVDVMGGRPEYYAAHNAEFDQSFLRDFAFPWICTYKAALRIWPDAPSHSNSVLLYWLGLHDQTDIHQRHPPHRAGPDAYVTAHILAVLLRHASPAQLAAWTLEPRVLPTCPIGEWRGRKWHDVDAGFLSWMIRKPVEPDLVWNARRELDRRRTQHMAGA